MNIFKSLNNLYKRIFLLRKSVCYVVQGDYWQKYFIENPVKTKKELENLKKNLDKESSDLIDLIFDRFIYLVPSTKYIDHCWYFADGIYTKEEKTEQNKNLNIKKLRKKYKMPDHQAKNAIPTYPKQTFLYDYGLKFLSDSVLKNLKNKDFLDCGAYIGDTALLFCNYTNNKIYAFEPNQENHDVLKKTIKINDYENKIFPIKAGLGEKEEELELYGEVSAASVLREHVPLLFDKINSEKIKITTIDKFVQDNNLNPGLIKMDIEGYELEAVKGALETIKKFKPLIIISVYHHPKDFFQIKPLIESLNLDYKFMFKKLEPNHFVNETVLIGYVDLI
ncbi:MAG TPA: FkbM family methyltransferase [Candidatus Gastranaerophilales bacterium]|nr:FkbM family methyltransferase [Candidatus Gastranaerophilales bacterium]